MKTTSEKVLLVIMAIALIVIAYASVYAPKVNTRVPEPLKPVEKIAGVLGGAALNSTTTDATWNIATLTTKTKLLKTNGGVLACAVLTGATTATGLNFYDATTTSSHANHATTTLGVINVSTPAGYYCFNVGFSRGLLVEFPSALGAASSTITWE